MLKVNKYDFTIATPIMCQFHFHGFRFVCLSTFCTRRRKECFRYDFYCSHTSIQVKRFSLTTINSYTESQYFFRCSRSLAQTETFLLRISGVQTEWHDCKREETSGSSYWSPWPPVFLCWWRASYPFATLFVEIISLKLYKAFILLHFYYCSSVGHFCGMRYCGKLAALNKLILRFILNDYTSYYRTLLGKDDWIALLYNRCTQNSQY